MTEIKIRKRLQEIEQLERYIQTGIRPEEKHEFSCRPLDHGITVIVPIHRGEAYMEQLIETLEAQTLDADQFETIIIFNGDYEKSEALFHSAEKTKNYIVQYSEKGVCRARNTGINEASFLYTAFLDVDDTLSPDYLEHSLEACEENTILLNQFHEVKGGKSDDGSNHINKERADADEYPDNYYQVVKNLSMNGAKVIPTKLLLQTRFEESLNNGEDVVLYMALVSEFKPIVRINRNEAVYQRHLIDGSLSRSKPTYQFNVTDRINVLSRLQNILKTEDDEEIRTLIIDRMRAQAGFINRYLKKNMEDYGKVQQDIEQLSDEYFPYDRINEDLPKRLYVSYCFPPYADTSGIVLAKRIAGDKVPCDVVHNNMYDVRSLDLSLTRLAEPYIHQKFEVNATSSFSNRNHIEIFIKAALKKVNAGKYKEIYSRAMWPASHMLAFEIYRRNSSVRWIAEFSDPLFRDIKNDKRETAFYSKKELKKIRKLIPEQFHGYVDDNLFNMAELLPFILADELVFTNHHQMTSMLERFDDGLQALAKEKATISRHPTLSRAYYNYERHHVELDENKINLGYFGNFYETRGAEDIKKIAMLIRKEGIDAVIHVFTTNVRQVQSELYSGVLKDVINVHPYLKYFEFLNVTQDFDYLLLNDAHTRMYKPRNPYLPSKYADYIGSGSRIWLHYEAGSVLHEISLEGHENIIANPLNDEAAIRNHLHKLTKK
ncbi:glycosyltransferase [Salinicoccus sp. ID82-1]|uniref:glycosyltransferase n=1 Tax=Salinicoccus sp. ID82-1 TaxID=2820269 RepID=UPI001F492CE9|nr:glycosyltransferase [Salinicoccus sp. ID82-1]MCG1009976.1 glycosyltransferase [Salinicoccus sp. ID82-1]